MPQKHSLKVTRRSMLANSLTVAAGAALAGSIGQQSARAQSAPQSTDVKNYTNADFYDAGGQFLMEKAREAYYDMFRRFHYPISETLKKGMWILVFGLGDFA